MTQATTHRGAAPVGYIAELDALAAATVIYMRLWHNGSDGQTDVCNDFVLGLGQARGHRAAQSFEQLCGLCCQHGRRPLIRHAVSCKCLGADESCFANFVATAADGDREDAMLMATLLVRPDVAPLVTALAIDVGLALKRMQLAAPQSLAPNYTPDTATLH